MKKNNDQHVAPLLQKHNLEDHTSVDTMRVLEVSSVAAEAQYSNYVRA